MNQEIKDFVYWASAKLYNEGEAHYEQHKNDDASIDKAVQGGKSVGIQKAAMRLIELMREYDEK